MSINRGPTVIDFYPCRVHEINANVLIRSINTIPISSQALSPACLYRSRLCPAGRYSTTGRYGPCLECSPGTFNNKLASKSCVPCAIGRYQNDRMQIKTTVVIWAYTHRMVDDFIASLGACQDDNVIGTCPKCDDVTDPKPVCATTDQGTGEPFTSYCELARALCRKGIIGFSENSDFTVFTESDYAQHVTDYTYWEGPCDGLCPAGRYSTTGRYGPCLECSLGFSENSDFTVFTESDYAQHVTDYTDWEGPCDGLCPAGRYSTTGRYGPCLECSLGTFNNKLASKSCVPCAIGTYQVVRIESGLGIPTYLAVSEVQVFGGDPEIKCPLGTTSPTGFLPCQTCPRVVRIESGLGIPTYLAVSEVQVFGGDPEIKCPLGTTSPTGFLPCQTCPRRYTTFKERATTCTSCPRDQTTTLKNPGKCIGHVLRVCKHDNLNPPCEEIEHNVPSVDTHQVGWLRDISALEAVREREYDCYTGDGSSYTGRESRTRDGKNCQVWSYDWPNQPTLAEIITNTLQEPTETSKQPLRTRYLGHVIGYQPIRDQYLLILSVSASNSSLLSPPKTRAYLFTLSWAEPVKQGDGVEPTEISKQPIRTCYLGHVIGYQPIRDQYFLIRSVSVELPAPLLRELSSSSY
eukprot:sb/3462975/